MKHYAFFVISLGLSIGLGFAVFITYFFWKVYFTGNYYWVHVNHVNRFNEFWFEFILFNVGTIVIFIALILLFKSYRDQMKGVQ